MKSMKFVPLVILALLLGACSNQPVGKWQERSQQMKLNAVQHWGLIAADAVEQTRLAINNQEQIRNRPLYVTDNRGTHFDRAFRNYMITGLVNAGMVVSDKKEGAVEISYESQVVRHGASFDPGMFGYKPGVATGGVAGFWILRDASTAGLAAGTLAAAAGYDAYKVTEPTGVELLLTTSIVSDHRYVMRNTDAYYIEKADTYLFEPCKSRSAAGCRPKYPMK